MITFVRSLATSDLMLVIRQTTVLWNVVPCIVEKNLTSLLEVVPVPIRKVMMMIMVIMEAGSIAETSVSFHNTTGCNVLESHGHILATVRIRNLGKLWELFILRRT